MEELFRPRLGLRPFINSYPVGREDILKNGFSPYPKLSIFINIVFKKHLSKTMFAEVCTLDIRFHLFTWFMLIYFQVWRNIVWLSDLKPPASLGK